MISKTFWHGKSVLVTGGSSGIGRELCIAAAAVGARVGMMARRERALAAVAAHVRAAGGVAEAVACDVTDEAAVAAAVSTLETRLGPTDVAIACAGIHRTSWPLDAVTARAVLDVNVGGTITFLSRILPAMLDRGRGHVCGVASLAAIVGLPGNAAYCASKAAMIALLESLRTDCTPAGVRVTVACPGFVDTPMVTDEERRRGGLLAADKAAAEIMRAIERGRAEVWFPAHTALAARLVRRLPAGVRGRILRATPPMVQNPAREP